VSVYRMQQAQAWLHSTTARRRMHGCILKHLNTVTATHCVYCCAFISVERTHAPLAYCAQHT
jgi:hypothetical protein